MKTIKATDGNYIIIDDNIYEFIKKDNKNIYHSARSYYYNRKRLVKFILEFNNININRYDLYFFKNGNKLDFRFENLINKKDNFIYYKKTSRVKTTSKYKGVSWDKEFKKWRVSIRHNGKVYHLGRFKDEKEAGKAYDKKFDELNLTGFKNFN